MAELIQREQANKTSPGSLTISFPTKYKSKPVVVISPYWQGQNKQISYIPTINKVTKKNFQVVSDNYADNYYVSWIAVGEV
ncbi:MAG: hypothetical protein F6K36_15795 [Symploca sp. SIO3C6]|nr:hypothetical protein [Symploca sp. SIO3C6]